MENEKVKLKRKIPHIALMRAPGLLNMLYKPSELATELGIPVYTIRQWTHQGLPSQWDSQGRLWINGTQFADWLETQRQQRPRLKLNDDEAFCLHCHAQVKLRDAKICDTVKPPRLTGTCSRCGKVVHRGIRK